jgi:hypothetical protein
MTKIKLPVPGEHAGCRVIGVFRQIDGSPSREAMTVIPEWAGEYNGVFYDPLGVIVTPDANGRYSFVLPPSSVLGDYTVNFNGTFLTIRVPDDLFEATFASVVVHG